MSDREYVYIVRNDSTGTAFFMPEGFESNVTVHLWGAGGGDGYTGTLGGGGAYVTSTLSLSEGDFVEIFVGNPGTNGGREIGGLGGTSGTTAGLNVYSVLNGKTADNSAPLPGDDNNIGAGGGGGGATAVIVNGNVIVAAAGGGGGAGGSGYQTGTVGNPGGVQTSPSGGSHFGGGGHGNSNYATGGGGGGGYPSAGENGYNVGDDVSGLVTGRGPAGGQGGYNFGGNITVNGSGAIAGGRSTEYYPTTLTLTEASSIRKVRYQKFRSSKNSPISAWPKGTALNEFLELAVGQTPPNTTLSRDLRSPELYGSFVYFIGPEPSNFSPTGTFFRTISWDYWQPVAEVGTATRPVANIANAGYPGYAVLVLERKFNINIKDSTNTWKKVTAAYVKLPSSSATFYRTIPPTTTAFASPGTSTFVVPPGVFSISASVTGGGGGGGGGGYGTGGEASGSGGGGGSGFTSSLSSIGVTPGETLTVVVGAGGAGGPSHYSRDSGGTGGNGGSSLLRRGASVLLTAAAGNGGTGGRENQTVAGGTGFNNGGIGLAAASAIRAGGNGGASTLASGAIGVASTGGGAGFAGITPAPSGTLGAGGAGGGASDGVGSGPGGDQGAPGGAGGAGQITLSYSSEPIAEIVETGGWTQITAAWTKVNNIWKSILSSNDVDILAPTTETYTSLLTNEFVVPAGCTKIYASLIGGGGGGGGDDSPYGGAAGFAGSVVKSVINVSPGDVLTIGVGGGGGAGASHSTSGAGFGGSSSLGFGGGPGGSAGPVPQSGAGGGGGAASVLKINNVIKAVAAGGGGGAGGGHRGPANTTKPSYANSAAFFGSAGQDKSGDGGGAGGGGGGFFGGSGGTNPGGDVGSNPGSDGSNLVPTGGFSGTANNQGAARANGGNGSITISYYTP